jgi:hypothetical protein
VAAHEVGDERPPDPAAALVLVHGHEVDHPAVARGDHREEPRDAAVHLGHGHADAARTRDAAGRPLALDPPRDRVGDRRVEAEARGGHRPLGHP